MLVDVFFERLDYLASPLIFLVFNSLDSNNRQGLFGQP